MIYDAFTFFNELDLLEIRLNILNDFVDKFVLVESHQTFSGQEKPLYYEENKQRFEKWNDKIIHIVVPNIETKNLFERHYLCYEAIENELLKHEPEDIAFCSDLDEIWNPEILSKIDDEVHSLSQLNYSYFVNYLSNEIWTGTLMSKIKNVFVGYNKHYRTVKPNILPNGGWHFSNAGGAEQIIKKTAAYDHAAELNHDWIREHTQENIDKGLDFLGRPLNYQSVPYKFVVEETKLPKFLLDNKEKYKHLFKHPWR